MHALELCLLLHRALEARVETLTTLLAVPGWQEEPEALHQVRVASRRVRSVLDLVRPELYPAYKRQARKLRRLTRALGLTREMDVHALYLEDLAAKAPGMATGSALEHALEVLETGRRKARSAMARELHGHPFKGLADLLKVPSLPDPFGAGNLPSDAWEALEPSLESAFAPIPGLLDKEDGPALHGVRIRIKRLRYALEVLGAAFAEPPDPALRRLRTLQTALGEHHDRAMLESALQDLYEGLAARGRRILGSGTLELLAYVGEARLEAFERFRAAARATALDGLRRELRAGLGLPEAGEP